MSVLAAGELLQYPQCKTAVGATCFLTGLTSGSPEPRSPSIDLSNNEVVRKGCVEKGPNPELCTGTPNWFL